MMSPPSRPPPGPPPLPQYDPSHPRLLYVTGSSDACHPHRDRHSLTRGHLPATLPRSPVPATAPSWSASTRMIGCLPGTYAPSWSDLFGLLHLYVVPCVVLCTTLYFVLSNICWRPPWLVCTCGVRLYAWAVNTCLMQCWYRVLRLMYEYYDIWHARMKGYLIKFSASSSKIWGLSFFMSS